MVSVDGTIFNDYFQQQFLTTCCYTKFRQKLFPSAILHTSFFFVLKIGVKIYPQIACHKHNFLCQLTFIVLKILPSRNKMLLLEPRFRQIKIRSVKLHHNFSLTIKSSKYPRDSNYLFKLINFLGDKISIVRGLSLYSDNHYMIKTMHFFCNWQSSRILSVNLTEFSN